MKKIIVTILLNALFLPQIYSAQPKQSEKKDEKSKSYWTKVGLTIGATATAAAALIGGGAYAYKQVKLDKLQKQFDNPWSLISLKDDGIFITQGGVNAKGKYGKTALMLAVYHRDMGLIKGSLEAGADPNIKMDSGDTALTIILQQPWPIEKDLPVIALLIDYGANPCIKNNKQEDAVMLAKKLPEDSRNRIIEELKKNKVGCVIKD